MFKKLTQKNFLLLKTFFQYNKIFLFKTYFTENNRYLLNELSIRSKITNVKPLHFKT